MKTPTFTDTLSPQTAHLDHPHNEAATVWGTVIGEARKDLPTAVAVQVMEDDLDELIPGEIIASATGRDEDSPKMPVGRHCYYLEGLVGCSFTIAAIAATFTIELAAAIVYCIASGFHSFVGATAENRPIIRATAILVIHSLMLADAILLTVSVIVTEVIGLMTGVLTSGLSCSTRSSCSTQGSGWRAYVRKVCHLTRWAFRDFHNEWALDRHFPGLTGSGEEESKPPAGIASNDKVDDCEKAPH